MLATYLVNGQNPSQAVRTVAKITGLEEDAIWVSLPKALRDKRKRQRQHRNRNRKIMQLAANGWTDEEIAGRADINIEHPKSVNWIISQQRRRAGSKRGAA